MTEKEMNDSVETVMTTSGTGDDPTAPIVTMYMAQLPPETPQPTFVGTGLASVFEPHDFVRYEPAGSLVLYCRKCGMVLRDDRGAANPCGPQPRSG